VRLREGKERSGSAMMAARRKGVVGVHERELGEGTRRTAILSVL